MNARGSYGPKGTPAAGAFLFVLVKTLLVPTVMILGSAARKGDRPVEGG